MLFVLTGFINNLLYVKSNECRSALRKLQHSNPYNSIGKHLDLVLESPPQMPRDAMRKCGLCPVSVRPSRRCIVTRRLKISSNFFLGPVAPSFKFFDPPQRRYPIPSGEIQRGRKIHGGGKNLRNRPRKRYETGPLLLWNVNRKS